MNSLNIIYYIEINLICIIFLSIILYQVCKKNKQQSSYHITFNWLIIVTIIMCICDMLAGIFRGQFFVGSRLLIYVSNWLYFLALVIISCLWTVYVLLKINEKIFFQKRKFWVIIPLIIYILVAITNPFTDFLFTINKDNLYDRGNGIIIHWIITWGYFVVTTLITIIACCKEKNELRKQEIKPLIYFFIAPLIAAIIQMFFYGVTSTQTGITISIILIYITLQNVNVFTDSLTELNNRRAFNNYIDNHIDRHNEKHLMIMIIDVNDFKKINDQYGHTFGDYILKEISRTLKQVCYKISSQIFLCRYGGDEFLIADHLTTEEEMLIIKDSIMGTVENIKINEKANFSLSVCIGCASEVCRSIDDVQELIILADKYMYDEKIKYKQKKQF